MFKKNLPNILTFSRIVVIPAILACFYFEGGIGNKIAAWLFVAACITDFFDGYLARVWSSQSNLGRFLDPIADKLLVGAVIVMMVHFGRADVIPAIAIICREILVSGLREFLAELKVSVPVSSLAKVKTAVQMIAIFLILLGSKGSGIEIMDMAARITLWAAAILTIITGYAYLKAGIKHMANDDGEWEA
jgi:cardiolipin synthase